MLVNTNRISVRNWFTQQLKAEGISYSRLYSNKAKTHPKAVLGYRMKYYAVKRTEHKNVPLAIRTDMINMRAEVIGLPYRLELERAQGSYGYPVRSLRIVPVSDAKQK